MGMAIAQIAEITGSFEDEFEKITMIRGSNLDGYG
jgi:hypothetical protein